MNIPRNVLWFEVLLYMSLVLDALSIAFQDRTPSGDTTEAVIMVANVMRSRRSCKNSLSSMAPVRRQNPVFAIGSLEVLPASAARELLTVVREQAVSRTLHRFGHVPPTGS